MADQWAIFVDGLTDLAQFGDGTKESIRRAAYMAINKVTRDGRVIMKRDIADQVNLPGSYLSPSGGRFAVTKQAKAGDLEGRITARGRSTSLARFVTGKTSRGLTVEVTPGRTREIKGAFLVKLRGKAGSTDAGAGNTGLAIRVGKGKKLRRSSGAVPLSRNLYLLYGPSVQQVFRANDGDGVASDRAPFLADRLEDEFLRLLRL